MKRVALSLWILLICSGLAAADEGELRRMIVETAKRYLGVPYVYGASSPSGFDCSGFVSFVYRAAGISIPRSSTGIWSTGSSVRMDTAKPGDVVVFNTVGERPSHVAILMENGALIHAVSSGPRTGVIISPINDRYFGPRIIGARTFIAPVPAAPAGIVSPALPAESGGGEPGPAVPPGSHGPVIELVGLSITRRLSLYADKIPAALGSGLQFALTNETGSNGAFVLLFYKMDMDPAKIQTLRQDRIELKAGETLTVDPVIFTEPGQYKLILKTASNLRRVERIWQVISL
ncbi:MAG: C40 family peptidase [Treponema sp.]|nr:C40 family peptidase [Treponema sp.]